MSKTMVDTYKELELEEYDEWKTGAGKNTVKTGGTSYDETTNRANYNQYVTEVQAQNTLNRQKNQLEVNKQSALASNNQNRENTMRDISVVQERAKEYVERRAKLNGTASAGVSQTSMVDLYSQMAGNRANAQASYDSQEQSILQSYRDAISGAENNYDSVVTGARQNTNNIIANNEIERLKVEEQKAEQAAKEAIQNAKDMASAQNVLNNLALSYTTATELEMAINTFNTTYGSENLPDGILEALEAAKAGTKSQYVTEQEAAQAAKDAITKAENMAAAKTALNNLTLTYTSATELEVAINTYKDLYGEENLPEGILDKLAAAKEGTKSQYVTEQEAIQNAQNKEEALGYIYDNSILYENPVVFVALCDSYMRKYGELPEDLKATYQAALDGEVSDLVEYNNQLENARNEEEALDLLYSYSTLYEDPPSFAALCDNYIRKYGELPEDLQEIYEAAKGNKLSVLGEYKKGLEEEAEAEEREAEIKYAQVMLNSVGRTYASYEELNDEIELFKDLYGEENLPEGILEILEQARQGQDSEYMVEQNAKEEEEKAALAEQQMENARYYTLQGAIDDFQNGLLSYSALKNTYEAYGAKLDKETYGDIHALYESIVNSMSSESESIIAAANEKYRNGEISFDELKETYEYYKDYLTKDAHEKGAVVNEFYDYYETEEFHKAFVKNNDFGITENSAVFDVSRVTEADISNKLDVAGGEKQTAHVEEIIRKLKNGEFRNREIINMNYGAQAGDNDKNYFVYYRGRLYQTTLTKDDVN